MPGTPRKPCRKCKKKLTVETYCASCKPVVTAFQKQNNQIYNNHRGTSTECGYGHDWHKVRNYKIQVNPLCECQRCLEMQRVKVANVVHHIKPINTHPNLRLTLSNLMSMSRRCHEVEESRSRDREYEQWKGNQQDMSVAI